MTPADAGRVTVVVPVLNGERHLDEVLGAVRGQHGGTHIELLVVDSGSTDGSIAIARRHGAIVHEIPNSEFGHGRTRNLAMELTSREFVAFITQDATPASPTWLGRLVAPFDDDQVAASYGAQLPRPDAHVRTARVIQQVYRQPAVLVSADTRDYPVYSDVNACVRRSAWVETPFRDVAYAEDFHLSRDLVARGWLLAYVPEAAVVHSNAMTLGEHMGRMLDEVAALPRGEHRAQARSTLRAWASEVRRDVIWARSERRGLVGAACEAALLEAQRAIATHTYSRYPALFDHLHSRWSRERSLRRRARR